MYVRTSVLSSGGSQETTAESDEVMVRTAVGWPGAWVSSAEITTTTIAEITMAILSQIVDVTKYESKQL